MTFGNYGIGVLDTFNTLLINGKTSKESKTINGYYNLKLHKHIDTLKIKQFCYKIFRFMEIETLRIIY